MQVFSSHLPSVSAASLLPREVRHTNASKQILHDIEKKKKKDFMLKPIHGKFVQIKQYDVEITLKKGIKNIQITTIKNTLYWQLCLNMTLTYRCFYYTFIKCTVQDFTECSCAAWRLQAVKTCGLAPSRTEGAAVWSWRSSSGSPLWCRRCRVIMMDVVHPSLRCFQDTMAEHTARAIIVSTVHLKGHLNRWNSVFSPNMTLRYLNQSKKVKIDKCNWRVKIPHQSVPTRQ